MTDNFLQNKGRTQNLSGGIYAIIGSQGASNSGFIISEQGVVVIDTDIRTVDRQLDAIYNTTEKEIRFLINTHNDFDHTSANQIFAEKGAVIISSSKCRKCLEDSGQKKFEERRTNDKNIFELTQGIKVVLPQMTFDSRLSIYLGTHRIELIHWGHAHTPGDIIIYLPEEKIVFAGDLLFNKLFPQTRAGNLSNWISIIDKICEMPIGIIVPGHGDIIHGTEGFQDLKKFFLNVKNGVEEMIKLGKNLEEIQKALIFPEYQHWGKSHNLPIVIQKIYQEMAPDMSL